MRSKAKRELVVRKLNALAESTSHPAEAEAAKAKTEKMKPTRVTVQIAPATERDPGQITYGYYIIVDGNRMVMTDGEGEAVRHENGELYERVLEPGQDPGPIARRFTVQIRKAATGESIPGFYRRISYPKTGIV